MRTLTHAEAISIIEEIARDETTSAGARVTAIRTLDEWRRVDEAKEPVDDGFAELYELEPPPARSADS
jgi:hypothetical protein